MSVEKNYYAAELAMAAYVDFGLITTPVSTSNYIVDLVGKKIKGAGGIYF